MAPRYADKTEWQGRGVYLFMAVGACIKTTAFSMGGIGGSRLRFCLSVYQIEAFYICLTFSVVVLITVLVGARLDQLGWPGEGRPYWTRSPAYPLHRQSLLS